MGQPKTMELAIPIDRSKYLTETQFPQLWNVHKYYLTEANIDPTLSKDNRMVAQQVIKP